MVCYFIVSFASLFSFRIAQLILYSSCHFQFTFARSVYRTQRCFTDREVLTPPTREPSGVVSELCT